MCGRLGGHVAEAVAPPAERLDGSGRPLERFELRIPIAGRQRQGEGCDLPGKPIGMVGIGVCRRKQPINQLLSNTYGLRLTKIWRRMALAIV